MPPDRLPFKIVVPADASGRRLDLFLVAQLSDVSRARVQQMLAEKKALVNGSPGKPSLKLKGGEQITVLGNPAPPPLRAIPEDIPLDVIYEDDDLAVINKPAGMMVHAGAGATESERNRGTLVNALLHRFNRLSEVGGVLRPGIVHRIDKETSGLIVVAKNDVIHRKLAQQFSRRQVRKQYIALVHGWPPKDRGTILAPISRDPVRRIRMTTKGAKGRSAVSHWAVRERIESRFGKFSLLDVRIETGRTHQIRVHLASIGFPIVGDSLYGAPKELRTANTLRRPTIRKGKPAATKMSAERLPAVVQLDRNFLHAASLEFTHPRTGQPHAFHASLPRELKRFLEQLRSSTNRDGGASSTPIAPFRQRL